MKIIAQIPPWMLLCLFVLSPTTEVMYNTGLPSLSNYFNVSANIAQMASTLYFLGFAFGILSLGRFSDIWGRRPIILFGLLIYIISSISSIFVINIKMLMILRFCQAFGASVGSVIGQAMARDSYQGSQLSYLYASLSIGTTIIPAIGSTIAGYIVEYSSWKYIFVFLSNIYVIILIIYYNKLPETNPYIEDAKNCKYLAILKVIIKDRILLLYAFIIGVFNGMMFGFSIEAPFIFIKTIGVTPSFYGKLAFLLSISSILGSLISGYLIRKNVDNKKIMILGLVLSLIGSIILVISSYWLSKNIVVTNIAIVIIFLPMMLHMVGHNLLIPITLRYALEDYSRVTGTAGSIFGSLYYILVTSIIFIISKIHSDSINNFALLFFILSFSCSIAFYLIKLWNNKNNSHTFN